MKYQIKEGRQEVAISVENVDAEKQAKVLEALQGCAEGRCSCPTNQYEKLESLDVTRAADAVNVELKVKPGQKIEAAEIRKCLDYTLEKASKG